MMGVRFSVCNDHTTEQITKSMNNDRMIWNCNTVNCFLTVISPVLTTIWRNVQVSCLELSLHRRFPPCPQTGELDDE